MYQTELLSIDTRDSNFSDDVMTKQKAILTSTQGDIEL